jgi:hypothetical protein
MDYSFVVTVVAINAVVTLWLLRHVRPKFKLKRKFRKALWHSGPIKPKHDRPPKPDESEHEGHKRFYFEFADFADVVNWNLADDEFHHSSWRLQELPKTLIAISPHGPNFGRTYAAFYNQQEMGKIYIISPVDYGEEKKSEFRGGRSVRAHIKLRQVRLLSKIFDFLTDIAYHVVDSTPQSAEWDRAIRDIRATMLKILWDEYHIGEYDFGVVDLGDLELDLRGTPAWYFDQRDCRAFAEIKRAGKIAA